MPMTKKNGIDVLGDAAGSNMLLPSFFPLETLVRTLALAPTSTQLVVKRAKVSHDTWGPASSPGGTASSSSHVCYICKCVYDRADQFIRDVRSREWATAVRIRVVRRRL